MGKSPERKKETSTSLFMQLLEKITAIIGKEFTSTIGKVNLISDIILAAIVVLLFVADKIVQLATIISSIFNQDLTQYLSAKTSLYALVLLMVFFILCIVFIVIDTKLREKYTK